MQFKLYTLYQLVKTQGKLNQWIESWEEIQPIEVVVSSNLYSNVTNDIVYRIYADTAITKFKTFEDGATYKIADADNEYEITSINTSGRYTQLLLKKVGVING